LSLHHQSIFAGLCHYPAGNQVVEKGRFNQVSTPLGERTTPKIILQADDD
jgi:hypothetical protein